MSKPFYIDKTHPGIIRGGFFDDMGGLLVGMNAQWVCDALNEKQQREDLPITESKPKRKT